MRRTDLAALADPFRCRRPGPSNSVSKPMTPSEKKGALVDNRPIERRIKVGHSGDQSRVPVRDVLEHLVAVLAISP